MSGELTPRSLRPETVDAVRTYWASQVDGRPTGGTVVIVRLGDDEYVRPRDAIVSPGATPRHHAHLAYADAATIAPPRADAGAVALSADDARLPRFRKSVTQEEWDESGLWREGDLACLFAVAVGDRLVAVSGYEIWDGVLAHVCVATSARERGRGHAKTAAAAATAHAIEEGLVAQWRASVTNPASVAVGSALGFVRLGEQRVFDTR